MVCPLCKKEFSYYNYYLDSYQTLFLCSIECQEKARQILTYNSSKISLRKLRKLLKELYAEEPKIKKEIKKTETKKEETPKPTIKINSFAYRLYMERVILGLSLEDLEILTGIDKEIINHLEKGKYNPTEFVINRLQKALGKKLGRK